MLEYDMIIWLDRMSELGRIIDCKDKTVEWEESKTPMTTSGKQMSLKQSQAKLIDTREPTSIINERKRLIKTLDAKYEKANLEDAVDKLDHLNPPNKGNY